MDALMTGMMKEGLSKEAAAENIYILDSSYTFTFLLYFAGNFFSLRGAHWTA
jgi:hypothetical protein